MRLTGEKISASCRSGVERKEGLLGVPTDEACGSSRTKWTNAAVVTFEDYRAYKKIGGRVKNYYITIFYLGSRKAAALTLDREKIREGGAHGRGAKRYLIFRYKRGLGRVPLTCARPYPRVEGVRPIRQNDQKCLSQRK